MEVLHNLMRMLPLPVGMHHDDATLPNKPLQPALNLARRERGVGIAGHDIPQNELEAEGTGHIDRVIVEFPIGRAKQGRVVTVLGFEQTNWSENFLFLLFCRLKRHMSVDFPMGADLKERDLEESLHLLIVFRDPFPGHEERGRDLLLYQIVDQCLIVARSVPHRAEIERQGDPRTRGRARLNHLGMREGRVHWEQQHRKNETQHPLQVTRSHGDEYTRSSRLRENDRRIPAPRYPMYFRRGTDNPQAAQKVRPARPQRVKTGGGTHRTSWGRSPISMDLGERKSPSSASDLRETPLQR